MSDSTEDIEFVIPCKYLRTNKMFHGAPDEEVDESEAGMFWCEKTRETFGPDGDCVGKSDCRSNRKCYLSY
ncbi:MAG: hypothetical protein HOI66_12030 [Verrucomicrobia bacterium]|nr:hypothetical protein [Verrucomicrobiota bacterium]MDA7667497.1 hypothetical protein [bacterium]